MIQSYLCKDCISQLIKAKGSSSGEAIPNESGRDHGCSRRLWCGQAQLARSVQRIHCVAEDERHTCVYNLGQTLNACAPQSPKAAKLPKNI